MDSIFNLFFLKGFTGLMKFFPAGERNAPHAAHAQRMRLRRLSACAARQPIRRIPDSCVKAL
jgi:hypothetical protein